MLEVNLERQKSQHFGLVWQLAYALQSRDCDMSLANHRRNPGVTAMQGIAYYYFAVEAVLMMIKDVWNPPRLQIRVPIFGQFSTAGS